MRRCGRWKPSLSMPQPFSRCFLYYCVSPTRPKATNNVLHADSKYHTRIPYCYHPPSMQRTIALRLRLNSCIVSLGTAIPNASRLCRCWRKRHGMGTRYSAGINRCKLSPRDRRRHHTTHGGSRTRSDNRTTQDCQRRCQFEALSISRADLRIPASGKCT